MKVGGFFGDLGGTRTHGPLIKSQLLYQLSYEVIFDLHDGQCPFCGCKYAIIFLILQE